MMMTMLTMLTMMPMMPTMPMLVMMSIFRSEEREGPKGSGRTNTQDWL